MFDYEIAAHTDDMEEFANQVLQSPGLVKASAAWGLMCHCGEPDCFKHWWQHLCHLEWNTRELNELLIERFAEMLIISKKGFDDAFFPWREHVAEPTWTRNCAVAVLSAWEQGPGRVFHIDGEDTYIGPGCPPPEEFIKEMRRAATTH